MICDISRFPLPLRRLKKIKNEIKRRYSKVKIKNIYFMVIINLSVFMRKFGIFFLQLCRQTETAAIDIGKWCQQYWPASVVLFIYLSIHFVFILFCCIFYIWFPFDFSADEAYYKVCWCSFIFFNGTLNKTSIKHFIVRL